ncbi:MAG: polysulfide reductase NrfD [Elusimicrobia bacterium]|nr:polysulfide reductase NrfD [Elusimicrobiota bacterium]
MTNRPWTFYVQLACLLGFYAFTAAVNLWFPWRAVLLYRLGDAWLPAAALGSILGPVFLLLSYILSQVFFKIAAPRRGGGKAAPPMLMLPEEAVLAAPVLAPPTPRFLAAMAVLGAISLWALFLWCRQLYYGLTVTGLGGSVFWGFYIVNFVFFIGISHAGTLISAILRIVQAEWRRAITRSAEVITVMVLMFGGGSIIVDMGRPDRLLNVFTDGRLQSPLLWDVCSITTYLISSTLYLYLPLIPDIAIIRDRCRDWRKPLYELLSLGWTGSHEEIEVLESCISKMALLVLPVAISVHTVVSYVFSMTIQPMWHSAIFGPYFVVGAIFSGIAALLIAMALLRKGYGLEEYLKPIHFDNLGKLLLVMSCLWFYFTFCEYLTVWYGAVPDEMTVFYAKFSGNYASGFWLMVATCFVFPFCVLVSPLGRTVAGTVMASATVCVGMWLERFLIVAPTLVRPRLPYATGVYIPTVTEIGIFAGSIAAFIMLYALFTRFFPIVSIWEVREGKELAEAQVSARIRTYFPS